MPVDLARERETFVRTFLKRGVELTEELLHENTALREQHARLMRDNARLKAQVASDDAIRDLLRTIESLECEKQRLLSRSTELEQSRRNGDDRFAEVEHELNDLANLYVAASQLHASLSPRRVVQHLFDVLGQFVGADGCAIYLRASRDTGLVPVAWENLHSPPAPVCIGEGPIGEACLTGLLFVATDLRDGTLDAPCAVVPIQVENKPVGAIVVVAMLEQKGAWAPLDRELFKLLGDHAGTALIAANLYADESGPLSALDGFAESFDKRSASAAPRGKGST